MKKTSSRILFFGNERLATGVTTSAPTWRALVDNGYEVAAVVVAQAEADKSRQARQLEIAIAAGEHDIPVISPDSLTDVGEQLASYEAEIGVLVAYGKIVPESVIKLFPRGIINIHPSLLPLHRGPTPLESVILEGSAETGVSLMQLAKEMDAGPVLAQQKVSLTGEENKQQLADNLAQIGSQMVIKNLPAILEGSLEPLPQDDSLATYDSQIEKADGQIDWTKPATLLEREVRAYFGWPRSRTKIGDIDVIITKAHVAEGLGEPGEMKTDAKQLGFATGEGLLIIDSLIPAGKKEMPAQSFLAGYKIS